MPEKNVFALCVCCTVLFTVQLFISNFIKVKKFYKKFIGIYQILPSYKLQRSLIFKCVRIDLDDFARGKAQEIKIIRPKSNLPAAFDLSQFLQ